MGTEIGDSRAACMVIAEVGSVHDGSFGNATKLIEVAAHSGCDAVKFQTHIVAAETLPLAPSPWYFTSEPRYQYLERTSFTTEQWRELKSHGEKLGLEFISSPFSIEAVELLESIGLARYKIASGEVTNLPLLEVIAQTRKPVLISSGMSTWEELDDAVNAIMRIHQQITVLQCTSEYPCSYDHVGLNVMTEMRERYRLPVGLSDHTVTPYASLAAVALGASVIERHLTFSRLMYGSDAAHSLEPSELAEVVKGIRVIERIMAYSVDKTGLTHELKDMKETFEKSVVSVVDIPGGTVVSRRMLGLKKPGIGMSPNKLNHIIGRRAVRDIARDTVLKETDFDD